MQYAHVENGSIDYIGELPKNWKNIFGLNMFEGNDEFLKTLEWFPATIIKEPPVARKAKENEVTYVVETSDKVIIVQKVREQEKIGV